MVLRAKDVATGVSFEPIVPLRKKEESRCQTIRGIKLTKMTVAEMLPSLLNNDCKMLLLIRMRPGKKL